MRIDRNLLSKFSVDLAAALQVLQEKYGITLERGPIRFNESVLLVELTGTAARAPADTLPRLAVRDPELHPEEGGLTYRGAKLRQRACAGIAGHAYQLVHSASAEAGSIDAI